MTIDPDVQRRSVTREDLPISRGVAVVIGPASFAWGGLLEGIQGATGLPPYGSKTRDVILSETPLVENMWASALNIAITRRAARGFALEDSADAQQRLRRAQALLLGFGGSWVSGLSRLLRDYLTCDHGAFLEIVRASSAAGSRILGILPLDSLRCHLTGDPAYPVLYATSHGGWRLMPAHSVAHLSDMPSARAEHFGIGLSAASRAFETILKLAAIETYFREKVSGRRNLAIHIVNGITDVQLRDALQMSSDDADARGFVVYHGSTILPTIRQDAPTVTTIPLAEVPDGFSVVEERRDAYLRYANALGVPVQEIQPLSGQGLGTGAQTMVLAEAAEGYGLAAFDRAFTHILSHRVLPRTTTYTPAVNDLRDQRLAAEVQQIRAQTRAARIQAGEISVDEARQLAADAGDLPRELLVAADATPGGAINDDEKPVAADPDAPQALPAPPVEAVAPAVKAHGWPDALYVAEPDPPGPLPLARARRLLAREARAAARLARLAGREQ